MALAGAGVFAASGERPRATTTASSSTAAPAARPVLALAARRRARPVAGRRPGRWTWTDAAGGPRPAWPASSSTSCTSARSRRRAPSTAIRGCRAARAGRHRDRADAGRDLPRATAAGATTASTLGAAPGLRRPRRARAPRRRRPRRGPRRAARRRLQPPRARQRGAGGVRPYFTDRYDTPWGDASTSTTPTRRRARVGDPERRACGCATTIDGLRLDAVHAILDERRRHVLAELADRVRAAAPGPLVIAESDLNDPRVPPRRGRRLGLRRPVGGRLPPRPARRADRRARRLLRRLRRGVAHSPSLRRPSSRRALLAVPAPPRTARPADRRADASWSAPEPRPGRQPRLGDRLPAGRGSRSPRVLLSRSCRCSSWARSTARRRRSSSSPTTSTRSSPTPRARAAGASSPRSPVRRRGVPDPQDPETFERSMLDPGRRRRRRVRSTGACWRCAASSRARRRASTRTPSAGSRRAARDDLALNFATDDEAPVPVASARRPGDRRGVASEAATACRR